MQVEEGEIEMEKAKRAGRKLKRGKAGGMWHTSRNGEGGRLTMLQLLKVWLEMWKDAK